MAAFGIYTLDLYCDAPARPGVHEVREFPHTYTDELGSVCRRLARKAGWVLKPDQSAICPKCNPKSRRYRSPTHD